MKYHYLFLVKEGSTAEEAIGELCTFLSDIYEMDDPETKAVQIGGYSDEKLSSELWDHVVLEHFSEAEQIDWQKQWADFSPQFRDGQAHIDLKALGGPVLLLKPGKGFGDLSHPTTRLVLALMAQHVKDKIVFDIGCGSGILSVAALLLGAKRALGIDIDNEAVKHSEENAKLNQVDAMALFSTQLNPSCVPNEPFIILMNMIQTEQMTAWQSLKPLHSKDSLIIASGVLSSERDPYLKLTQLWGWSLAEEKEEEGWLGFVFSSGSK